MVYAVCEEQYTTAHESLKKLCERIEKLGSCQDGWVYYLRSKLPHFKNHTNNRLENFFGKLKDAVDGSTSMAGCVKALIAYDRRVENEYKYRLSRIGQFVNSNYDEEMKNVLRFTTHFVAQQIEHQYATALSKAAVYSYTVDPDDADHVVVGGVFSEHNLRIGDWSCDCDFSLSMCLPCRHAIAYRKHTNVVGPIIPWDRIDERWTCSSRPLKKVKQFSYEKFTEAGRGSTQKKNWGRTQNDIAKR
ncbi:hypothetical protein L917_11408 [Phytophthora nicotianae]|uniref:SWIM-type domain-containing protein n=1 Tax=Phytophthora nicotianae TaxID=4792 RepID=W2KZD2_PHYNI|nr:hypothetical protein L917_11408 [Phytophthora nicotianae]